MQLNRQENTNNKSYSVLTKTSDCQLDTVAHALIYQIRSTQLLWYNICKKN